MSCLAENGLYLQSGCTASMTYLKLATFHQKYETLNNQKQFSEFTVSTCTEEQLIWILQLLTIINLFLI